MVQPQFTPPSFWCGCSVCSPAPTVCLFPFNNLLLAKSLTLPGLQRHCLRFTPGGEKHTASFTPLKLRSLLHSSFCQNQVWLLTCIQIQRGLRQAAGSVITVVSIHRAKRLFSYLPEITFWELDVAQRSNLKLKDCFQIHLLKWANLLSACFKTSIRRSRIWDVRTCLKPITTQYAVSKNVIWRLLLSGEQKQRTDSSFFLMYL